MKFAGPRWRGTQSLRYHIYFIPFPNGLDDFMAFSQRRSFSYRLALSLKVTESGSVHSSSYGCRRMDSDGGSSNDDHMKIDKASESSGTSQLAHFVFTDYFSKKWMVWWLWFSIFPKCSVRNPAGSTQKGKTMIASLQIAHHEVYHFIHIQQGGSIGLSIPIVWFSLFIVSRTEDDSDLVWQMIIRLLLS